MVAEPGTAVHASRVMSFAVKLAQEIKLDKQKIENLKVASLLHDLGKLAIDEKILFKPGKLTKEEFEEIKAHPTIGTGLAKA